MDKDFGDPSALNSKILCEIAKTLCSACMELYSPRLNLEGKCQIKAALLAMIMVESLHAQSVARHFKAQLHCKSGEQAHGYILLSRLRNHQSHEGNQTQDFQGNSIADSFDDTMKQGCTSKPTSLAMRELSL